MTRFSSRQSVGGEASVASLSTSGRPGRELPERIVAEVLVVVEVFAARREGEDPLSQQTALRMRDQARIPRIGNRTVQRIDQAELPVGLAQQ